MRRIGLVALIAIVLCGCSGDSGGSGSSSGSADASAISREPAGGSAWALAADAEMIDDPVGDSVPETSGFLDTVAYGVSRTVSPPEADATFSFVFEVAAPVPDSFTVPLDYDAAQYSFCLDSDPETAPAGYPFVSNDPIWCEFIITAVSQGEAWTGTLIDRRPLLNARDAGILDVPFVLDDTRTKGLFTVPAALLDDPPAFDWAMTASVIALPLPGDDFIDLDQNYLEMLRFER